MGVAAPLCCSAKCYYYYSPLGDNYERKKENQRQQQEEEVKKKERERKKRRQTCSTCSPPSLSSRAGTPAPADTHGSKATLRLPLGCVWEKILQMWENALFSAALLDLRSITHMHSLSVLWRQWDTACDSFLHRWRNMSYFALNRCGFHRLDLRVIGCNCVSTISSLWAANLISRTPIPAPPPPPLSAPHPPPPSQNLDELPPCSPAGVSACLCPWSWKGGFAVDLVACSRLHGGRRWRRDSGHEHEFTAGEEVMSIPRLGTGVSGIWTFSAHLGGHKPQTSTPLPSPPLPPPFSTTKGFCFSWGKFILKSVTPPSSFSNTFTPPPNKMRLAKMYRLNVLGIYLWETVVFFR